MKKLEEYNIDDEVEVYIHYGDTHEWRSGVVKDKRIVYPGPGERHRPYTMILVEVIRTYFDPVALKPYDKLNKEWFCYAEKVKPFKSK